MQEAHGSPALTLRWFVLLRHVLWIHARSRSQVWVVQLTQKLKAKTVLSTIHLQLLQQFGSNILPSSCEVASLIWEELLEVFINLMKQTKATCRNQLKTLPTIRELLLVRHYYYIVHRARA